MTTKTQTDTYKSERWYKFTVSGNTTITLEDLTQDHRLYIYASNGTTPVAHNTVSGTNNKSVELRPTGPTTYYAQVYYDNNKVENNDTYTLRITPPVGFDVGETMGTAMAVSFVNNSFTTTQRIGDGIYGNRDVDMYSITVTAADVGRIFTFRTALPPGGTSVDTYIRLFNSSGTQLAFNDDYGGSLYSYLVWTPTTVGTYYLGVSSYGNRGYNPSTANSGPGGTTGDYTLTVTR